MTGQELLLAFFVLNWLLIIADASLGYFVLPLMLPQGTERGGAEEPEAGEGRTLGGMRRLLTVMVLLYMFVNCYAYYRGHGLLLYVVTGLVLIDIVLQLVIRRRKARQG